MPPDNPFVGRAGAKPEIYTYGHRNGYGLTVHPTQVRYGRPRSVRSGAMRSTSCCPATTTAGRWSRWAATTAARWCRTNPSSGRDGQRTDVLGALDQPVERDFYNGDKFKGWKEVFSSAR